MRLAQRPGMAALAVLSLLAITASAADPPTSSSASAAASSSFPDLSSTNSQSSTSAASTSAATTSASSTSASSSASSTSAPTSTSAPPTTSTTSTSAAGVTISGGSSAGSSGTIPSISGGSSATGGTPATNFPTITGGFRVVAASVPPTAGAPYLKTDNMPEGTVFIAVGAILGFALVSLIAWRVLSKWAMHRSVQRAALQQNMSDTKSHFRTPAAPFYKYTDNSSTISLSGLNKSGKKGTNKGLSLNTAASNSSLFFSPTAAGAGGMSTPGNRASSYLPAGYYAAGSSQPGNGQGMAQFGGAGNRASSYSTNLRPQSQAGIPRGKSPMSGLSPPGSPGFNNHGRGPSSSTLNLTAPPGEQRTPSTYLEDLFDGENPPPMPHHPSSTNRMSRGRPI